MGIYDLIKLVWYRLFLSDIVFYYFIQCFRFCISFSLLVEAGLFAWLSH